MRGMKNKEGSDLLKANPGSLSLNPFTPNDSKTEKETQHLHPPITPCPVTPNEFISPYLESYHVLLLSLPTRIDLDTFKKQQEE